jgi:hypothetical protein
MLKKHYPSYRPQKALITQRYYTLIRAFVDRSYPDKYFQIKMICDEEGMFKYERLGLPFQSSEGENLHKERLCHMNKQVLLRLGVTVMASHYSSSLFKTNCLLNFSTVSHFFLLYINLNVLVWSAMLPMRSLCACAQCTWGNILVCNFQMLCFSMYFFCNWQTRLWK